MSRSASVRSSRTVSPSKSLQFSSSSPSISPSRSLHSSRRSSAHSSPEKQKSPLRSSRQAGDVQEDSGVDSDGSGSEFWSTSKLLMALQSALPNADELTIDDLLQPNVDVEEAVLTGLLKILFTKLDMLESLSLFKYIEVNRPKIGTKNSQLNATVFWGVFRKIVVRDLRLLPEFRGDRVLSEYLRTGRSRSIRHLFQHILSHCYDIGALTPLSLPISPPPSEPRSTSVRSASTPRSSTSDHRRSRLARQWKSEFTASKSKVGGKYGDLAEREMYKSLQKKRRNPSHAAKLAETTSWHQPSSFTDMLTPFPSYPRTSDRVHIMRRCEHLGRMLELLLDVPIPVDDHLRGKYTATPPKSFQRTRSDAETHESTNRLLDLTRATTLLQSQCSHLERQSHLLLYALSELPQTTGPDQWDGVEAEQLANIRQGVAEAAERIDDVCRHAGVGSREEEAMKTGELEGVGEEWREDELVPPTEDRRYARMDELGSFSEIPVAQQLSVLRLLDHFQERLRKLTDASDVEETESMSGQGNSMPGTRVYDADFLDDYARAAQEEDDEEERQVVDWIERLADRLDRNL